MDVRRYHWLIWMLLGAAACSGSGSSGFDNFPATENAAIQQALTEQRCVESRGLTICPGGPAEPVAATASPTPTPTPAAATPTTARTATATSAPEQTRTPAVGPTPVVQPTSTTVAATPTPPATASPTPTEAEAIASPSPAVHIDTGLDTSAPIACVDLGTAAGCRFMVSFMVQGFLPGTQFRVALRAVDPIGPWTIADEAVASTASAPEFDASIPVQAPLTSSPPPARVQIAVLVFGAPTSGVPTQVETLADSGADFAFVTGALTLQPAP
jgi:hypothetical protein